MSLYIRSQLWLFAPAYGSDKVILTFEEVAKALKGKVNMVEYPLLI